MHKAVESLKVDSKNCFKFFMLSLLCFHISSFLLLWLLYPGFTALFVNFLLLVFLFLFVAYGYEIVGKLYVADVEAVSGKFENFSRYENMPDLDTKTPGGFTRKITSERAHHLYVPEQKISPLDKSNELINMNIGDYFKRIPNIFKN